MDNKSFWLANIGHDSLAVSYVAPNGSGFTVASIGPNTPFQFTPDSFVVAIDESLTGAALKINLPENDEPDTIALIISPFWVGSDGKIASDKLKLFESMFKELKLRPVGFISYDEAIVEEANIADGYPISAIIVKLETSSMLVSLSYLGKVIERVSRPIINPFDPSLLESALLDFTSDSTLPPLIIIIGNFQVADIDKVKNYTWIGKKNIETFLHFPDVKCYDDELVTQIYLATITSQFKQLPPTPEPPPTPSPALPAVETVEESTLVDVDPSDMGFVEGDNFIIPDIPETTPEVTPEMPSLPPPKPPFRLPPLPSIIIPKLPFPALGNVIILSIFCSLIILVPFYFSSAQVTLYITPYEITKTVGATLDPATKKIDLEKNIIPVNKKTFDITSSASVNTTGTKTIGEKAQGEIVVFNKQDKVQQLNKGSILIDTKGNKFELNSSASIASSSSDLSLGVINLGKTNVMVTAQEIGPELNIPKETPLNFKDFSPSLLIAKANGAFSGGSKKEAQAVSPADKTTVTNRLNDTISTTIDERIAKELTNNPNILKDAVQTKKGRTEYSREVGEETDELSATIVSTISVYYFDETQKQALIDAYLSSEPEFKSSTFNLKDFVFHLDSIKSISDSLQCRLTINGQTVPKVDKLAIAKLISGKKIATADNILKNYPRVYKYKISTNLPFLNSINPLPFRITNITIEVK
jgi:hypothetical protein